MLLDTFGGIIGSSSITASLAENVINLGKISDGSNSYSLIGLWGSGTANNCYYLNGTSTKGINTSNDSSVSFEMKDIEKIIESLNNYIKDNNKSNYLYWNYNVNDGFILESK